MWLNYELLSTEERYKDPNVIYVWVITHLLAIVTVYLLTREEKEVSLDWYQDVKDFHEAMDLYIGYIPSIPSADEKKLRQSLHQEEFDELKIAMHLDDMVGIADGLADLIYVLNGTAVSYGIDLRPIWDLVQESNMKKLEGPIRLDGKRLKPEGWLPPDIKGEIERQRYAAKALAGTKAGTEPGS